MLAVQNSLKADLVEYEEKYERCKSENMATAAQLDKLTNDFERIRGTFEDAQTASSECDARLAVSRLSSSVVILASVMNCVCRQR